jgi:hypothetical protein
MTIVNHSFSTGHEFNIDNPDHIKKFLPVDYNPFSKLTKEIATSRKGATFMRCPAVTDTFQNTWVFKSPIDLNIDIDVNQTYSNVYCDNVDQEFFDLMVDIRFLEKDERGISPYPIIGLDLLNTFTCEQSLMLQTLPAFLHYNDFTNKATTVPGEYDINKWVRPVELVFEVKNKQERISIKKGDALCYFKFLADDNVKLQTAATPWEEIIICNDIRNADLNRPLKERYKSYSKVKKN